MAGGIAVIVATGAAVRPLAPLVGAQAQAPAAAFLNPAMSGENAPVLVQFTLDNSYPASELPLLDAALDVLPSRSIMAPASGSLDDLLRQEFALTPSATAYQRLRADIERRRESAGNPLSAVIRIPAISPYTPVRNNLSAFLAVRAGREATVDSPPALPGGIAFGPNSLIQAQTTTYVVQATARDLADGPLRTLAFSSRGQILAKQIRARLATNAPAQAGVGFVLQDIVALRDTLATATRDIYLFVLDTGWPSDDERTKSLGVLKAMCASARAWYRFPSSPFTLDPAGALPPPDDHVVNIKASLRDIEALSPHVHVIYVPMTLAQNSEPLLREIITLGMAISRWGHPGSRPEPSQGRKAYEAVAPEDVDNAIATISRGAVNGEFQANSSLLRGLFAVAAQAASQSGDGYFANMSWTTDDADILAQPVEPVRGFIVAAVGNDETRDVVASPLAFAGLAPKHLNMLAVMTMNDHGALDCHTSRVTFRDGPADMGAVGYFGVVSPTTCFSSFATPRVAWFLAARDTLRTTDVASIDGWVIDIRYRLNALRAQGALPGALLFNPLKYIR